MGGGAAGYTAAIYLARANLSPLVLTGSTLEKTRGGRASPDPSHPHEEAEKISADDKMRAQATRWGARCLDEDVEAVDVEAVDVEAVDVEAVDATSTPVVISLVGGGEVRCRGAILAGSSVSDAYTSAGRAPASAASSRRTQPPSTNGPRVSPPPSTWSGGSGPAAASSR